MSTPIQRSQSPCLDSPAPLNMDEQTSGAQQSSDNTTAGNNIVAANGLDHHVRRLLSTQFRNIPEPVREQAIVSVTAIVSHHTTAQNARIKRAEEGQAKLERQLAETQAEVVQDRAAADKVLECMLDLAQRLGQSTADGEKSRAHAQVLEQQLEETNEALHTVKKEARAHAMRSSYYVNTYHKTITDKVELERQHQEFREAVKERELKHNQQLARAVGEAEASRMELAASKDRAARARRVEHEAMRMREADDIRQLKNANDVIHNQEVRHAEMATLVEARRVELEATQKLVVELEYDNNTLHDIIRDHEIQHAETEANGVQHFTNLNTARELIGSLEGKIRELERQLGSAKEDEQHSTSAARVKGSPKTALSLTTNASSRLPMKKIIDSQNRDASPKPLAGSSRTTSAVAASTKTALPSTTRASAPSSLKKIIPSENRHASPQPLAGSSRTMNAAHTSSTTHIKPVLRESKINKNVINVGKSSRVSGIPTPTKGMQRSVKTGAKGKENAVKA